MSNPNFKQLGAIGLFEIDGTPCIAIQQDEGEPFIQSYKGMGPMVSSIQTHLRDPEYYEKLGLTGPAESMLGTAYRVQESHRTNTLVPESRLHFIACYLRASVAQLIARRSNLCLDFDLPSE